MGERVIQLAQPVTMSSAMCDCWRFPLAERETENPVCQSGKRCENRVRIWKVFGDKWPWDIEERETVSLADPAVGHRAQL